MYFVSKMGIFHCYVSLPEGICKYWTFAAHHASLPDTASSLSTIASWNIMERDTPKVDSNQKKGTWSSNTCVCFSGMFVNFRVPSLKITARSWKMLLGSEKSFSFFGALSASFCGGKLELVYTCFREVLFVSIFLKDTETELNKKKERTLKTQWWKLSYPPWN